MRMVHDDVIQYMRSVAEGDFTPAISADCEQCYEDGKQDGYTLMCRDLLQRMGVSYTVPEPFL